MNIKQWFNRNSNEQEQSERYRLFGATATKKKRVDNNPTYVADNPNTSSKLVPSLSKYADYLLDAHIASCVQSRKAGVLSMEWEIETGDTMTEQGEFVQEIFDKLDLHRIMNEMLDAVVFGYKPMEIFWDVDSSNRIIVSNLIGKPQWWFRYIGNSFRFITYNNAINGEVLNPYKFLFLQHNATYTNPYGEAVIARCHFPLQFKKAGMELWGQFTEKYGMPFLHGTVENGKDEELDSVSALLYQLQQDGSLATNDRVKVNPIDTNNGDSPDNYQKFIHFCNAEISKAILSQTLTTEQGDTGSYGMSQTHLQVRKDVVQSDSRLVESAFNTLIKFIIDLNYADTVDYPRFVLYGDVESDIQLATRDQMIFSTGFCKPTKEYLMRHHSFKADEVEIIEPVTAPQAFSQKQNEDDTLKGFEQLTDELIKPILDLVEQGTSFENIEKRLIKHFPKMDYADIENYLAKVFLQARVLGLIEKE